MMMMIMKTMALIRTLIMITAMKADSRDVTSPMMRMILMTSVRMMNWMMMRMLLTMMLVMLMSIVLMMAWTMIDDEEMMMAIVFMTAH